MLGCLSKPEKEQTVRVRMPEIAFCGEKNRLTDEFLTAIQEMNALHSEQTTAVIQNDPDFSRFDVLLLLAQDKKERAKYALMAHIEVHRCAEA